MPNKLYRHKKTGNVYEVITESGRIEADWSLAVIYKKYGDHDSHMIARPYGEFHDGRFESLGSGREAEVFDPLADVEEFHNRFGLDALRPMGALDPELMRLRYRLLQEELDEWWKNQCAAQDEVTRPIMEREEANYAYHLEEALDGLVDLAYVLFGTVHLHGFSPIFREAWGRVHYANMQKVRAELDGSDSKRNSFLDVVKPAGWEKPRHGDLIQENDIYQARRDMS